MKFVNFQVFHDLYRVCSPDINNIIKNTYMYTEENEMTWAKNDII